MKILLLGGTTEASALAAALAGDARFDPTLSLAGRTRCPPAAPIASRSGGFGGPAGLADYLRQNRVAALVDATHPFAVQISANAVAAAAAAGVPLLALRRPAWLRQTGDNWTMLDALPEAVAALGSAPRRVFLTIGRQELAPFRSAPWHHYVIRSVDPPEPALLPPACVALTARGPFSLAAEQHLLADHGIEVVVTKNSGGTATYAKLAAARALGLPVLMVRRPTLPPAETVATAPAALAWLTARHEACRGV